MTRSLIGRMLAALLLLAGTPAAHASSISGGGGGGTSGLFSGQPLTGGTVLPFGYGPETNGIAQPDQIRCAPAYFAGGTISALNVWVRTLSSGGFAGAAIYNFTTTYPRRPATLQVGTLTLSTNSQGAFSTASVTATPLAPGWYFFCTIQNNSNSVLTASASNTLAATVIGAASAGSINSSNFTGVYYTVASASFFSTGNFAWPADLSSTSFSDLTSSSAPIVYPTVQ